MPEKAAQKEAGKKPAPSQKPKPQQEVVIQSPLSELHPFPNHPFQVREDASMQETAESVKEYGVLDPALAQPREDRGYELIAGHRKHACELAGLTTMPVIVRNIDRDAATIIMVDSNLQRENIIGRTWWLSLPPCAIPTTNTSSPSMSCDVGNGAASPCGKPFRIQAASSFTPSACPVARTVPPCCF